jgi:hypothetical protein
MDLDASTIDEMLEHLVEVRAQRFPPPERH